MVLTHLDFEQYLVFSKEVEVWVSFLDSPLCISIFPRRLSSQIAPKIVFSNRFFRGWQIPYWVVKFVDRN